MSLQRALDQADTNKMLRSLMVDPESGEVGQIGMYVRDHEHFRSLLNTCAAELRYDMYCDMVPYLRFKPKALDVYLSETADLSDRKQLPIITADGGLRAHPGATDVQSLEFIANQAILAERAKHRLTLTCRKCTRQAEFIGERKADCITDARMTGWAYDSASGFERCPVCMAGSRENHQRETQERILDLNARLREYVAQGDVGRAAITGRYIFRAARELDGFPIC